MLLSDVSSSITPAFDVYHKHVHYVVVNKKKSSQLLLLKEVAITTSIALVGHG